MRPPPYRRPLPEPFAGARRRLLLTAWLSRPTPPSIEVDGFNLLFEPGLPDPRPALGFSAVRFLLEALDVRPGERLLDIDCGAGSYFSVIIAHKESGIEKLPDLKDATFGYNDPLSQSGIGAFFTT